MNYGIMNAKTKHNITIRTALWEEKKHDIGKKGGLGIKTVAYFEHASECQKRSRPFFICF